MLNEFEVSLTEKQKEQYFRHSRRKVCDASSSRMPRERARHEDVVERYNMNEKNQHVPLQR